MELLHLLRHCARNDAAHPRIHALERQVDEEFGVCANAFTVFYLGFLYRDGTVQQFFQVGEPVRYAKLVEDKKEARRLAEEMRNESKFGGVWSWATSGKN